jgi:hypothetical protein
VLNGNDVKAEPECGQRVGPKKRAEVEKANHLLFGVLLVVAMPSWAQRTDGTTSDQTQCGVGKIAASLRDKNPQVLREVENQWIQAYGDRDAQLLACILAADFEIASMPDEKLEINGKQHVIDWMGSKSPSSNTVEHLDIKTYGQAAVVRGSYLVRTPDGKPVSRFQFTDVFLYRTRGWQAVSREIAALPLR